MISTDRIEVNPKIMMGKPVIRGTRITVEQVLRKLGEGDKEEDILKAYPRLTRGDIHAAICYAADALAHGEYNDARGKTKRVAVSIGKEAPRKPRTQSMAPVGPQQVEETVNMSNPLDKLKGMQYAGKPITWYKLARLLQVSDTTILAWRTGYFKPNPENQAKIDKLEQELEAQAKP